jgi:5-epi-alpha-selinene synthase
VVSGLDKGDYSVEGIVMPRINCKYPSRINLHAEALRNYSLEWATRHQLIKGEAAVRRFIGSCYYMLPSRAYPNAGMEDLKIVNDWLVLLFMWDDQFDEAPTEFSPLEVESILEGYGNTLTSVPGFEPQRPVLRALQDVCRRTYWRMPPWWRDRFAQHTLLWLETYIWSVNNSRLGLVPPLDLYVEKRRHTGAMNMVFDLIDFAEHLDWPERVRNSACIEELTNIANDAICWANDVVSLEKEIVRGEVNNLVIVIKHAENLTLQQSVDRVGDMINARMHLFEEKLRDLPSYWPRLDDEIQKYAEGLRAWMRANLDWSSETLRYSEVEKTRAGEITSYREDLLASSEIN